MNRPCPNLLFIIRFRPDLVTALAAAPTGPLLSSQELGFAGTFIRHPPCFQRTTLFSKNKSDLQEQRHRTTLRAKEDRYVMH